MFGEFHNLKTSPGRTGKVSFILVLYQWFCFIIHKNHFISLINFEVVEVNELVYLNEDCASIAKSCFVFIFLFSHSRCKTKIQRQCLQTFSDQKTPLELPDS